MTTFKGPIGRVISRPFPSSGRSVYWLSIAESELTGESLGIGWGVNEALSQEKAVTLAIERLAYAAQWSEPGRAGLDRDPSTTGFAAAPRELGESFAMEVSYFEAVERETIRRWNASENIAFRRHEFPDCPARQIFPLRQLEQLDIFLHNVVVERELTRSSLVFVAVAVAHMKDGMLLLGTACADLPEKAAERATLEARHHRGIAFEANNVLPRLTDGRGRLTSKASRPRLSSRLSGFWEPDFVVTRVLLEGS